MIISLPKSIEYCLKKLTAAGYPAYVVGGCVRDSLLGNPPSDWDLCTSALPDEVTACFFKHKVIPTGLAHGTVTVLVDSTPVEITTFRSDGDYQDHRHPASVDFTISLRKDLARRDFTINALAFRPGEEIVDCYGGMEDLAQRRLRCVGDARARFSEDALRILRLFRFSAQLEFVIMPDTLTAARECSAYLEHVSSERVCAELSKLLVSPEPGQVLAAMCGCGVLQQIIPEFAPCVGFDQRTPYHNRTVDRHTFAAVSNVPPVLALRLALLLHDIAKPLCFRQDGKGIGHFPGHEEKGAEIARVILERLRFDRRTIRRVTRLIALHDLDILPEDALLRRQLSQLGEEMLLQLLEIRIADTRAKDPQSAAERLAVLLESRAQLARLLSVSPAVHLRDLAIDGADLLQLGYPPGKETGQALRSLLDAVLDDPSRNNREWLTQRAKSILEQL